MYGYAIYNKWIYTLNGESIHSSLNVEWYTPFIVVPNYSKVMRSGCKCQNWNLHGVNLAIDYFQTSFLGVKLAPVMMLYSIQISLTSKRHIWCALPNIVLSHSFYSFYIWLWATDWTCTNLHFEFLDDATKLNKRKTIL